MQCAFFGSWIKERVIFMCSALVVVYGLKNELYSCAVRFVRFIDSRTRYIHVYSALVSVHGVKKEVYLCVARLFWFMD